MGNVEMGPKLNGVPKTERRKIAQRYIDLVGKLHKRRVEQASFAVLKAPDIPSVLVEAAFISNPSEEEKLNSPLYLEQLADALMRGIEAYFSKNPPLARNRASQT
jgi:N-acetylmuramoyl-L-alanine amidase